MTVARSVRFSHGAALSRLPTSTPTPWAPGNVTDIRG